VGTRTRQSWGRPTLDDLKAFRLGAQIGTTSLAYIENVIQPDEPALVFDDNTAAKVALDASKSMPGLRPADGLLHHGGRDGRFGDHRRARDSRRLADYFGLLMAERQPAA
jgi:hypothetical protein